MNGMKFFKDHFIMTEKAYPYMGVDQKCMYDESKATDIQTEEVYTVMATHPNQMKAALANHGPLTVALEASFHHYESGIFDDPKCGCNVNHAVLMVGYGVEKG